MSKDKDKDLSDSLNLISLDNETVKLAQQIINEDSLDEIKNLTKLFNLNQSKKNAMRVLKLNSLLDKVSDQMIERFEKKPGEFSNADLLNYMTITQNAIDRANKSLNLVEETPAIQLQQNNQINVNIIDSLSRDSKDRVTEAVKSILSKINSMESESSEVINQEDSIIEEDNENEE